MIVVVRAGSGYLHGCDIVIVIAGSRYLHGCESDSNSWVRIFTALKSSHQCQIITESDLGKLQTDYEDQDWQKMKINQNSK